MTFYGIYKITNLLNGKMYIGQHKTDNLDDGYMGSGKWLRRAIKKYGVENFRKEWIMFCEDAEELNYMERVYVDQTWIDRSDTYNLRIVGDGGGTFSEEHKRYLSIATKECQNRPSVKARKSKFQKEYKNRPEVKAKCVECLEKWRRNQEHYHETMSSLVKEGMKNSEHFKNIVKNRIGNRWWNNGVINKWTKECPEGFVVGRLTKKNLTTK